MSQDKNQYPPGWDRTRVDEVLRHYERQTDEEAAAEDDAAFADVTQTVMGIPVDLVPAVREMIARRRPA